MRKEQALKGLKNQIALMNAPIRDACVAIECRASELHGFRAYLLDALRTQGIECEYSAETMHISIAYGLGEIRLQSLEGALAEIAERGFYTRATGFDILEGQTTPYDYLVLQLEACRDFDEAVEKVEDQMPTRKFKEGFKSHVSLLRFPKGELTKTHAKSLVRELNASHSAAFALGRCVEVEGDCVCVFGPEHEARIKVQMPNTNSPRKITSKRKEAVIS